MDFWIPPKPAIIIQAEKPRILGPEILGLTMMARTFAMRSLRGAGGAGGPTANTSAWNPSSNNSFGTLTNSNRTFTGNNAASVGYVISATSHVTTGKWYAECTADQSDAGFGGFGVAANVHSDANPSLGGEADEWAIAFFGSVLRHNGLTTSAPAVAEGNVLGVAWDAATGSLWFSVNGVYASGNPATGTSPSYTGVSGTLFLAGAVFGDTPGSQDALTLTTTLSFGPSGFSAWS